MNSYETLFIVNPNVTEEELDAEIAKVQAVIETAGEVKTVDKWGKRKLAYLINDEAEGYYVLFNIECEPAFPAEFQRVAGITDGVLRSIVVKK